MQQVSIRFKVGDQMRKPYINEYNKVFDRHEEPEKPFFIRGTTPPFEFTIFTNGEEVDLSSMVALEATVSQEIDGEKVAVTKTAEEMDVDGGKLQFVLTQDETLLFSAGTDAFPAYASVQVRGLSEDGFSTWATIAEKTVLVLDILKEGTISAS